jgi:hypothetical protein
MDFLQFLEDSKLKLYKVTQTWFYGRVIFFCVQIFFTRNTLTVVYFRCFLYAACLPASLLINVPIFKLLQNDTNIYTSTFNSLVDGLLIVVLLYFADDCIRWMSVLVGFLDT